MAPFKSKTYSIKDEQNKIKYTRTPRVVPDISSGLPGLAWESKDREKSKDCLIEENDACKYIELPKDEIKDESHKIGSVYQQLISHRTSALAGSACVNELRNISNSFRTRADSEKSFFKFICPPFFILIVGLAEIIAYACGDTNTQNLLMYSPYQRYQVWRYVTYMLIHSDVMHLTLNIVLQTLLATPIEFEQRWWRCAIVYTTGGIVGALGASVFQPNLCLVGASAGVYAVLVSHIANVIVQYGNLKYKRFRLFSVAVLAGSDIAFSVAHYNSASGRVSPIGWAAHCAGAFTGITLGLFIYRGCDKTNIYVRILSYISLLLFLTGVIALILLNVFFIKA